MNEDHQTFNEYKKEIYSVLDISLVFFPSNKNPSRKNEKTNYY